jgi:MoaA/NifB/PqqE/SkfB family radical SAM enzyme
MSGSPGDGERRGFKADWPRYLGTFSSMVRSRLFTHRPFFLAHAATFGCNSKCLTCSYWKLTPRMKEDLSTEEVYAMLDEAYDAGMRGYYLFGGEPLVRKDVGALVTYARRRGFLTTINTNGSLLAAKAESLKDLDIAFVSLDYPADYNDYIRGRPGTFGEVTRGIDRIRAVAGTRVVLVTTISSLNREAVEPMARFAERMGVGISFNSVEPTLDFGLTDSDSSPNFQYGLSPVELRRFYVTLLRLKREGYPLMETEQVLRDFVEGRRWKCEFPKMFVYVSPDKKIYSCDYRFGYDLRQGSFEDYFRQPQFLEHVRTAENCNRCIRTCVRGYSYTYELKARNLVGLASEARALFRTVRDQRGLPGAGPTGEAAPVPSGEETSSH